MIKREFKVNLKSFIIWLSILILMFLTTYLIYPYIITDEAMKSMDEMMKMFPPELLKSFNMDLTTITTAYGWVKSEGFVYFLLAIGIYASFLGLNAILKEENDKTIEYSYMLPLNRSKILTNKILVGICYIVGMVLFFGLFNYICLLISGDFDQKQFILLSFTPIFIGLPFYAVGLFISMFLHKTNFNIGIGLGMVFIFYILNMLSELSDKVSYLKYFSIYTLADTRNVIMDVKMNPILILISFAITIFFIILSYIKYQKKELI